MGQRFYLNCQHLQHGARVGSANYVGLVLVTTCWDCSDAIDEGRPFPLEDGRTIRIG